MARVKKINAEGSEKLKDSTPEKEKKGVENMRAAQTLSCFTCSLPTPQKVPFQDSQYPQ